MDRPNARTQGRIPWETSARRSAPRSAGFCGVKSCGIDGTTVQNHSVRCIDSPGVVRSCGTGRPPFGLEPAPPIVGGRLGAYWASVAYLEDASIVAFEELASILERRCAPASLVRRARRAAKDERRHARLASTLATLEGTTVPSLRRRADASAPSTLLELAVDNDRAGCLGETYAAIEAEAQARLATSRRAASTRRRSRVTSSVTPSSPGISRGGSSVSSRRPSATSSRDYVELYSKSSPRRRSLRVTWLSHPRDVRRISTSAPCAPP